MWFKMVWVWVGLPFLNNNLFNPNLAIYRVIFLSPTWSGIVEIKESGPDEGGMGEIPPPCLGKRKRKIALKMHENVSNFKKFFSCGAYRHRRRHQSFKIIKAKFLWRWTQNLSFSRLRRRIFATKIFYQNFCIIPPDVKGYVRHWKDERSKK